MSTAKVKPPTAALIAHVHLQAAAYDAEDLCPPSPLRRGGVLSVERSLWGPRVAFRKWTWSSLIIWEGLTKEQQRVLYLAILSTPYGRSVSASRLTAWIPVKGISKATFNSLLDALTTPKDVAKLSRLLRSIAYDDACLGS